MSLSPWYGTVRRLNDQERFEWLRLYRSENIGPITFMQLMLRYKTAEKALAAIPTLAKRGGRARPLRLASAGDVQREIDLLHKFGGRFLAACEPDYPTALRYIDDAPPILAMKGHVHLLEKTSVAIVGARNASLNGRKIAQVLASELGGQGYVITSGLARGIDAAAHSGGLAHGTIAVVAGGIDQIYPKENTDLYKSVCELGLILSEAPFGTMPQSRHFPKRNRIVSGLSQGVIVVEAAMRSGSLITARMALEQGREVMAVPGSPLDPRAHGTNRLIRDGAALVENAEHVLAQLRVHADNFLKEGGQDHGPLFEGLEEEDPAVEDSLVFERARRDLRGLLSPTPTEIDELIRASGVASSLVHALLLEMELAGIAQRLPGNRVMLIDGGELGEDEAPRINLFDL